MVGFDEFVDAVEAVDRIVVAGRLCVQAEMLADGAGEDVVDERAFAGTADAGDGDETA